VSRNEITIGVPRERVFAVLGDASTYADWVVGASDVRDADENWPEAGTKLHHTQLHVLEDETRVLESDPPGRLVLLAELQALGTMRVTLDLYEEPGGQTRVVMEETPEAGAVAVTRTPLTDLALKGRNVVSLRRLKELAETT